MTRAFKLSAGLVAVCALAGACDASHSHNDPDAQPTPPTAARRSGPSPGPRTPLPSPLAHRSSRAIAAGFAAAYARYLEGRLPAEALPGCSPGALVMIEQSGSLPARLRVRRLWLIGVQGADRSWSARYGLLDAAGRQTLSAGLTLTPTGSGWQLTSVDPPDIDAALVMPRPAPPAAGPAAARAAALAFTASWLAFTYQQASAARLQDLTASLHSSLAVDPPRVPPAIAALHPRVASLALQHDRTGWLALANVTDGHNTYQVITQLSRVGSRWLVSALRSAG